MRRAGLVALGLALLAGLAVWVLPWGLREREMLAGVPSPRALFAIDSIVVGPGQRACSPDVGLDDLAEELRMQTLPSEGPRPPLRVVVAGQGYRSEAAVPRTAGSDLAVVAPVDPPPRDLLVEVCVANEGRAPVALAASSDRTRSRSITAVDGEATGKSAWLTFAERPDRSLAYRAREIASRMATFRPGFVVPALLWLLGAAVVVGVPAAVLAAWSRGLRDEEP